MNALIYTQCNQCGLYHEALQSPSADKRLRFTRYTLAELAAIHGEGAFTVGASRFTACPSARGPVVAKKPTRKAA